MSCTLLEVQLHHGYVGYLIHFSGVTHCSDNGLFLRIQSLFFCSYVYMNLNISPFYAYKRALNILELPGIEPLLDLLRSALSLKIVV